MKNRLCQQILKQCEDEELNETTNQSADEIFQSKRRDAIISNYLKAKVTSCDWLRKSIQLVAVPVSITIEYLKTKRL